MKIETLSKLILYSKLEGGTIGWLKKKKIKTKSLDISSFS